MSQRRYLKQLFKRALIAMSFSLSTFTVEINSIPTIAFQAKWHVEADELGRGWATLHRDELSKDQHGQLAMPPVIKVRLASAVKKAAYEAAANDAESCGDVKTVKLPDVIDRQAETGTTVLVENMPTTPQPNR